MDNIETHLNSAVTEQAPIVSSVVQVDNSVGPVNLTGNFREGRRRKIKNMISRALTLGIVLSIGAQSFIGFLEFQSPIWLATVGLILSGLLDSDVFYRNISEGLDYLTENGCSYRTSAILGLSLFSGVSLFRTAYASLESVLLPKRLDFLPPIITQLICSPMISRGISLSISSLWTGGRILIFYRASSGLFSHFPTSRRAFREGWSNVRETLNLDGSRHPNLYSGLIMTPIFLLTSFSTYSLTRTFMSLMREHPIHPIYGSVGSSLTMASLSVYMSLQCLFAINMGMQAAGDFVSHGTGGWKNFIQTTWNVDTTSNHISCGMGLYCVGSLILLMHAGSFAVIPVASKQNPILIYASVIVLFLTELGVDYSSAIGMHSEKAITRRLLIGIARFLASSVMRLHQPHNRVLVVPVRAARDRDQHRVNEYIPNERAQLIEYSMSNGDINNDAQDANLALPLLNRVIQADAARALEGRLGSPSRVLRSSNFFSSREQQSPFYNSRNLELQTHVLRVNVVGMKIL